MSKRPRGSIRKIREFELEKLQLVDEFDILQIVGEGWFGKILLVEHRASHSEMVLKAVPKPYVSLRDFFREFHYGLHLGIHRNIVTTYDVAFETAGFYVFTQEYAPLGDLTSNVTDIGIGEVYSKRVARQIGSALDYMHSKEIVHRDVKLDNILIYRSDFTKVKLCDFGESYEVGSIVERRNEWLPYSPPEVLEIKPEGTYKADPSHDVWQFGIVIFVCLTGCLPWQKAASEDPRYVRYLIWSNTMMLAVRRTPKLFKLLTSRAQRLFKRFLEPRADRRPKNLTDLAKFIDDRWLAKSAEKEMAEYETDELCPSMYSFHSSPDEKNRTLFNLADCGIETNVDRQTKKNRIREWIESSVITEEDEEEQEDTNSASSPSSSISREPIRGHISSLRTPSTEKPKEIKTTLKDASQKHFDPRTGVIQQGPSEMGVAAVPRQKSDSPFSMVSNMSTMNNDSLAGSLLTLGSRPDLLSSNLDVYGSSNLDLNRMGSSYEQMNYITQTMNQTQFSGNDVQLMKSVSQQLPQMMPQQMTPPPPLKNSIGVGTTRSTAANKSILQRTKSDTLKTEMFDSLTALDAKTTQSKDDSFSFRSLNPFKNFGNNSNSANAQNNANNKSVTFTGIANSFQTMAPIVMAPNIDMGAAAAPIFAHNQIQSPIKQVTLPQQQQLNSNLNNKDSPVKDSGYGSMEASNEQTQQYSNSFAHSNGNSYSQYNSTPPPTSYSGSNGTAINGKSNFNQPIAMNNQNAKGTVRTQSSQQQRVTSYNSNIISSSFGSSNTAVAYNNTPNNNNNSMKDTAYDRYNLVNTNNRR